MRIDVVFLAPSLSRQACLERFDDLVADGSIGWNGSELLLKAELPRHYRLAGDGEISDAWSLARLAAGMMRLKPNSPRCQGAGCLAIADIAEYCVADHRADADEAAEQWAHSDDFFAALQALADAMRNCPLDHAVQFIAVVALNSFLDTTGAAAPTSARLAAASLLVSAESPVVKAIVDAVRHFPGSVGVQAHASDLISHLKSAGQRIPVPRLRSPAAVGDCPGDFWEEMILPQLIAAGYAESVVASVCELMQPGPAGDCGSNGHGGGAGASREAATAGQQPRQQPQRLQWGSERDFGRVFVNKILLLLASQPECQARFSKAVQERPTFGGALARNLRLILGAWSDEMAHGSAGGDGRAAASLPPLAFYDAVLSFRIIEMALMEEQTPLVEAETQRGRIALSFAQAGGHWAVCEACERLLSANEREEALWLGNVVRALDIFGLAVTALSTSRRQRDVGAPPREEVERLMMELVATGRRATIVALGWVAGTPPPSSLQPAPGAVRSVSSSDDDGVNDDGDGDSDGDGGGGNNDGDESGEFPDDPSKSRMEALQVLSALSRMEGLEGFSCCSDGEAAFQAVCHLLVGVAGAPAASAPPPPLPAAEALPHLLKFLYQLLAHDDETFTEAILLRRAEEALQRGGSLSRR